MTEEVGPRSHVPTPPEIVLSDDGTNLGDEERGLGRPSSSRAGNTGLPTIPSAGAEEETELQTRPNTSSDTAAESTNFIKRKTSQLLDIFSISGSQKSSKPLPPKLSALLKAYADSEIAASIKAEITEISQAASLNTNGGARTTEELPDVVDETAALRTRSRASYGTQFRILSGRAFKNLYRDPALLTAHYVSSIVIAREQLRQTHR